MPLIELLVYTGIFLGLYFASFILLTFLEHQKDILDKPRKKEKLPRVCLIVPCYNEEKNIAKTLYSLLSLDYPKEKLEIIVVNDGSKDGTLQKAHAFERKYKNIKVFSKENGGKYTALNYGIEKTDAPFVGSVDADSFLHPQALKKLMRCFKEPGVMAATSTVKVAKPRNILERIQAVEYLVATFLRKVFSYMESINVTPGPLSVFKKDVFKILGPYKEAHQTEDLEMAFRLQKAHFKIRHSIDAIVYTEGCATLKSLFRQRLRWQRGFLLNLKDYAGLLNAKKHGNLSFVLIYGLMGGALAATLSFYALWKIGDFFAREIHNLALVGFRLPQPSALLKINWFSFDVQPSLILGILSLSTFLFYLLMGRKFTFEKEPLKKDSFFYLITYPFLNAFWWVSALISIALRKKTPWE